jgi:hypothetical protein
LEGDAKVMQIKGDVQEERSNQRERPPVSAAGVNVRFDISIAQAASPLSANLGHG